MMPLIVGVLLALGVGLLARVVGLDRDRAFYPAVTLVVASYYALFAVLGESSHALLLESLVGVVFLVVAMIGFRSSLWLVALALAGHGVFDLVHGGLIANPGMPVWWPEFCMAYDVAAAGFLAWLLKSGRVPAAAAAPPVS